MPRTKGCGQGGIASYDRFGKQAESLFDEPGDFVGTELFQYIGYRGLLGGLLAIFLVLALLRLDSPKLFVELAPSDFELAGHLGKQFVAVFNARSDIPGTILKLALALKIECIEEHLGHGLGIFLLGQPLRKL